MNTQAFLSAYNDKSRNGANEFIRHGLVRSFVMSDGVHDCAEAGCHWLMDIAATELPKVLITKDEYMGILSAKVKNGKAKLSMTGSGDVKLWSRTIDYTDMPDGTWKFYVSNDSSEDLRRFTMILPSEY